MTFLQINLNHSIDANDTMFSYALEKCINCILCQDPHITNGKLTGISDNLPFFISTNLNAAVVFLSREYTVVSTLVLKNSVFVNVNLANGDCLTIASQYSPPSSDFGEDLEEWSSKIMKYDYVLIGGD